MTKSVFIQKLSEALMENASKIQPDTQLTSLSGWDSMGKVAFLSFLDEEFGYQPPHGALDQSQKVSDLMTLVKSNLQED